LTNRRVFQQAVAGPEVVDARSDDGWLKARADQWFGNLDWAAIK
jgi:hypothetical protein